MKNNYKTIYGNSLFLVFCFMSVPFHALTLTSNGTLNTNIFIVVTVQQPEVHGHITDAQGMPLAGVSISVKGTQKGTVSDFNGYYSLAVDANEVLVFSFLGFKTKELPVQGRNELNLVLETDITTLNAVEINAGYYTVSDRERTGSIARLDAKTIDKQPVNNPIAAMQGHLSGVNIVQSTGVPGGGYSIEIRGKNFISGNSNPLFIIDGVPFGMESLESSLVGSGINRGQVSPLNSMNPMDIESIEVLKDADATAIYGSRGANGVVLITTKKGKAGVTRFQTHVSTTLGRVSNFLDLINTEQYLEVVREGVINDGYSSLLEDPSFDFIWPDLKTWDQNRYTNWQKELIGGTAYRNNAQLSVSGGSAQTQFLLSGSVLKETTVFPGDGNYKKLAFHSTINHQSEDNRFKLNLMAGYTIEDNQLPRQDFTSTANRMQPHAPKLYDDDGNLNWENNTWDNPLAALEQKYRAEIHTLIANLGLSYQIVDNLEFRTNFGYTTTQLESTRVFPSTALKPVPGLNPSRSSFDINTSGRHSWIMEPQLHWQPKMGDLSFSILAGTSFQQNTAQNLTQTARGFSSNALLLNLSAAKTVTVFNENESDYRYHAIFGRVNLQWKDKYIINLTGRRDGSSRFGPGKQFGNFGAIGAAWLFSEEAFFINNSILSFGKLRGSYGTTGSDNIGDYKFLSTYNIIGLDYNGISALEPTGVFNPFFGWETNKKLEVALELGLFKDRVFLNASWYKNRSSNQLIGIPLAATTGFSNLIGNFDATVENTGIEVDLRTMNLQSDHFRWETNFNLTVPKNKLVHFHNLENSAFANRFRIGESLTSIPLYQALGVDPDTGLYQFEDYNDDGTISALEDKKWFEDLAPEFYGGFGNTLTYKQVTLDFFFQFKKQKNYNYLKSGATIGFQQNAPVAMLNRWQAPGDISPIQRASGLGAFPGVLAADEYQRESNAAISDASFIRLRNITLTYRIPKPVNNKLDVSIYLQGQNLLTITGYDGADPEQASMEILPPLQQMTVGVQLAF